jgi:hypothetical protein
MFDYFVAALFLALTLAGAWKLRESWSRSPSELGKPPPWWPWGVHAWNAFDRQLVPSLPGVALLALGLVFPEQAIWAFLFMLVIVPLGVSIALFNRPKFLVPPAMRAQPGLISAYSKTVGRRR